MMLGFVYFLIGLVTGFLVCVIMTVDLLRKNSLFDEDGKVINLRSGEVQ